MTLRIKTLAVIGTTLVLMIIIISIITKVILLGSYEKLEEQNIRQNAEQAVRMIDDELAQIKSVVGDWAPWDDTYQFIQDGNQKYLDDNLTDATMINLPVDFLVFISNDKKTVYCKFVDPEKQEDAACPDSLLDYVMSDSSLLRSDDNLETLVGLSILTDNPVFIASGPIMTSQFQGPVKGTLVAGRYLDAREVTRLATKVNLSIRLQRMDRPDIENDFKLAKQSLSDKERVAVIDLDENTIAAFSMLTDLHNKPILMLGIDNERRIFAQGKASMHYFILSILVIGLVFIVAVLLFVETTVLARVIRLNKEINTIGITGNLLLKTTAHGKDELADLSAEINQMLESVRVSTERDRAILESIEDGYFEMDQKGGLTFSNDSLAKLFGYKKDDLLGLSYHQVLNIKSAKIALNAFKQLYKTGQSIKNLETGFAKKNGEEIFLESTVSVIKDETGTIIGFRGIARDVTERKMASEKLLYMAYHDPMTGLLNRKAFYENLEKELLYAGRYNQQRSVLFVDLDKFKKVNDTYGHRTGDQLLTAFASRVQKTLRNADMIYRLGGDEFAVILSNPQDQSPEVAAQRIIDLMKEPFLVEDVNIDFVTTSIGISTFPMDGTDVESLLVYADKAMYQAKKTRNSFAAKHS